MIPHIFKPSTGFCLFSEDRMTDFSAAAAIFSKSLENRCVIVIYFVMVSNDSLITRSE